MSKQPTRDFRYQQEDFDAIRTRIHEAAGIWLADSKQQMVYSRIVRRLRALGLTQFSDYLKVLDKEHDELELFINALTTNLTSFFRESHHFEALKTYIQQHHSTKAPIRIWCAAASTGEEPYSIAITAMSATGSLVPNVSIFASDINSQVLATAQRGVYAESRIEDLDLDMKRRFFLRGKGDKEGLVRVRPELKRLIEFHRLNLLDQRWPIKDGLDVIFCRNVMIYFNKETQSTVLKRMVPMLKLGGLYIAGHSESLGRDIRGLESAGKTVYRRIGGGI
ncbi:CheR family methyltransferase [Reinekea blandensis]|uniref:Chemotaxis protein methyltransferase n=1 Tax=Reinekea blandensis MED297 TaxID=314283 RepID=A4BJG6_9GAMM|nr:CheR family methyltransferase [Reinekea blandensis]EAR07738.1 MCP methyltransferase, CheR-type [Reinekea sp. MED297] [Reinekea blandensis MED297]